MQKVVVSVCGGNNLFSTSALSGTRNKVFKLEKNVSVKH